MQSRAAAYNANLVADIHTPAILTRQGKLAQQCRGGRIAYVNNTDGKALVKYVRSGPLDDDLPGIHATPTRVRPGQGLAQSH